MYVAVHRAGISVEEPDDCTSLEVRVDEGGDLEVGLASAALGTPIDDGEHVALRLTELRSLCERESVGTDWPQRWDAMIAYAESKGWVSADGATVRAHVAG